MNNENLVSLADRTMEEKRKIGQMGGIASGKARREKAELKKTLLALLENDFDIEADGKNEKVDGATAICYSLIKKAISGDVKAFTTIRDTIGETVVSRVAIEKSEVSQETIDEIEKMVMGC